MIEPQVEHGGASSWFCIAAKLAMFDFGAGAGALADGAGGITDT